MSRKQKKYAIVPDNTLYTPDEIKTFKINEDFLYAHLQHHNILSFLAMFRLIPKSVHCLPCSQPMHLMQDASVVDKCRWYCSSCRRTTSIRTRSFFNGSKLPIATILKLIYKLSENLEGDSIGFDLNINKNTVSKWSGIVRDAVLFYFEINKMKIGGVGEDGHCKTVEVDESLFFKRKYNRGTARSATWYIGGVERGSTKCFIVPVERRDALTISRVISENVFGGSRIITDEWRAYGAALRNNVEFTHRTINHTYYFVDPNEPEIHTQGIESFWSHSKRALRKKKWDQ